MAVPVTGSAGDLSISLDRMKPDFADAYNNCGQAPGNNGDSNRAIADREKANQLDP